MGFLTNLLGGDRSDATTSDDERAAIVPRALHRVLDRPLTPPFPEGIETVQLGMGCFWGAERLFWQTPGVWVTAVGYAGGEATNPGYKQVCSGRTGHAEVVLVAYDSSLIPFDEVLRLFWENHDPTQGMRQGNDRGSQYRSAIYWNTEEQRAAIERSRAAYEAALAAMGMGPVTTEIREASEFWYAEDHHQQYLQANPGGYCNLRGTGVTCSIGEPAQA